MSDRDDWISIGQFKIDPRLLETRAAGRCLVQECRATCCGYGVYVDLADANRVMEEAEVIKPHLPPDRRNVADWFDGVVKEDSDFPSGHKVGTQIIPDPMIPTGSRCVFLRPDQKCALQVASVAVKHHPWDLKPFYCCLYPVTLLDNGVELDEENEVYGLGGSCQRPASPVPLYKLLKEEMVLALGQEGYDQLCAVVEKPSRGRQ
jgi:Fe-S-cluster containining protein